MSTNDMNNTGLKFDLPKGKSNIIKVIGVGGGGCNAVNHMHIQGIKGVDYVICNTDAQALENSPVTNKIQLGVTLTEGLGAGADPEIGEKAAEESLEEIRKVLEGNTQMVFITAGMGGGTGTGAAPVIAKQAKEMGILTVAIVTSPFTYEGLKRSKQAQAGIKKLRECVDSLIVINNNKISEIYGDLGIRDSYAKADEILLKGAKGMAEVISKHYIVNIDLNDARTVLGEGGTAIMGSAIAEGENRAFEAISGALNSPLLNDNKITGAKNALLLIVYGSKQATTKEIEEISNYVQMQAGENMADLITGIGEDESLGDALSVTVIATGFDANQQHEIVSGETKKVIHVLDDTQPIIHDLTERNAPIVNTNEWQPVYPTPTAPSHQEKKSNPQASSLAELFNIWVDCEVLSPEQLFTIVEKPKATLNNNSYAAKERVQPQRVIKQEPIKEIKKNSDTPVFFHLSSDINEDYEEPKQITPTVNQKGEIRHSLEDYMELEKTFNEAKPFSSRSTMEENRNEFILYRKEEIETPKSTNIDEQGQMSMFLDEESQEIDPVNSRISDVMARRSNRLQNYNHVFGSSSNYSENNQSRTSISKDSSGEYQIRRNNSFLHDNVD
ncbi:cell division protein FtsZ [Capnocytophaga felis]|uniref:Cell division protein FtsZ n=1 Tax=Capnocytophaga felis TaxID=2267611 RepID=A0A5M4BAT1_9FLAO|nr:cell division protein FtsZ [Capnocytophaga felis]GET46691.1 cell division protein FtsZ [Capnocytophaga felis]GET48793.1 cell division protein FtsZ [Capnocytophaga felis]